MGSRDVMILFAAMQHDRADEEYFITTGRFTKDAVRFAKAHPNLHLVSRRELRDFVAAVFKRSGNADEMTVACAECGDTFVVSLDHPEVGYAVCRQGHPIPISRPEISTVVGANRNAARPPKKARRASRRFGHRSVAREVG